MESFTSVLLQRHHPYVLLRILGHLADARDVRTCLQLSVSCTEQMANESASSLPSPRLEAIRQQLWWTSPASRQLRRAPGSRSVAVHRARPVHMLPASDQNEETPTLAQNVGLGKHTFSLDGSGSELRDSYHPRRQHDVAFRTSADDRHIFVARRDNRNADAVIRLVGVYCKKSLEVVHWEPFPNAAFPEAKLIKWVDSGHGGGLYFFASNSPDAKVLRFDTTRLAMDVVMRFKWEVQSAGCLYHMDLYVRRGSLIVDFHHEGRGLYLARLDSTPSWSRWQRRTHPINHTIQEVTDRLIVWESNSGASIILEGVDIPSNDSTVLEEEDGEWREAIFAPLGDCRFVRAHVQAFDRGFVVWQTAVWDVVPAPGGGGGGGRMQSQCALKVYDLSKSKITASVEFRLPRGQTKLRRRAAVSFVGGAGGHVFVAQYGSYLGVDGYTTLVCHVRQKAGAPIRVLNTPGARLIPVRGGFLRHDYDKGVVTRLAFGTTGETQEEEKPTTSKRKMPMIVNAAKRCRRCNSWSA